MSDSMWPQWLHLSRLPCLWDSPGKNTGTDSHSLLQGIFSTQGSNPHLFMSTALAGGFLPLMPPGKLLSRKQLRLPGIGWLACHSLLITGQVRIPGIRSGQLPLSPVVPDPLCFSVLLKPVTLSKFPLPPSLFSFSLPASSAVANLIDSVNK